MGGHGKVVGSVQSPLVLPLPCKGKVTRCCFDLNLEIQLYLFCMAAITNTPKGMPYTTDVYSLLVLEAGVRDPGVPGLVPTEASLLDV